MEAENQANIKKLAQDESALGNTNKNIIVVLGASDFEGAEISAETVIFGDPSFTGPLAGVSLRLPVYHILEPEIRDVIPKDIYEEHLGIWAMTVDTEELGRRFRAIRERSLKVFSD